MGSSKSGRVDQETWDRLVEAFRDDPGNYSAAARRCLVQRRTARRAYEVGYPERPWGTKSIKQLLMEEAELARTRVQIEADTALLEDEKRQLDAERDREAARQHAIRAKQEEAVLVAGARAGAMRALGAVIEAVPGIKAGMVRLTAELEKMAVKDGLTTKEMVAISSVARRFSSTLRDIVQSGQMAMEMERLYLGEPTEIIKHETDLDDLPLQDLVRMAGYQDEVLQRAATRGVVNLPGVGKTKPDSGPTN